MPAYLRARNTIFWRGTSIFVLYLDDVDDVVGVINPRSKEVVEVVSDVFSWRFSVAQIVCGCSKINWLVWLK